MSIKESWSVIHCLNNKKNANNDDKFDGMNNDELLNVSSMIFFMVIISDNDIYNWIGDYKITNNYINFIMPLEIGLLSEESWKLS